MGDNGLALRNVCPFAKPPVSPVPLTADSPFFTLSFKTLSKVSYSFLSVSAIITVSLICLRLRTQIINPGKVSSTRKIVSMKRLNKSDEKIHPCLPPFLFCVAVNTFSIRMKEVYTQCKFWIIITPFSNNNKNVKISCIVTIYYHF